MDSEFAYTRGMTDDEIEQRLTARGTGVLSLAADGDAYAVALAHYYDGDALYFRVGRTEESDKLAYFDSTETACYTVYDTERTDEPRELDSWSIIVTGPIRALPDDEHERFDAAEINRQFSPIRVFGEDVDDVSIRIHELRIETITGRCTPA